MAFGRPDAVAFTATPATDLPSGFGSAAVGGLGAQPRLAALGPPQTTPFARGTAMYCHDTAKETGI